MIVALDRRGNWSGWLQSDAEKWCARPPTQLLIAPVLWKSVHWTELLANRRGPFAGADQP